MKKTIYSIFTVLTVSLGLMIIIGGIKSFFNMNQTNYEETRQRIELQFSDTELQIIETEKDVIEIGKSIERMERTLDSLLTVKNSEL